ncbi:Calcium-transporting ATPase [Anaerohalosphaera lusitana]|uniref:Calcium-transporting ATPase n=1 Tax=Anaerohalosphaera lusitana TaxID=1936003 RepID=A0A1U9NJY0_9BACT|nr:cation-transporting P-type ATPase [Anaerohalosphaera lusitana]AQT67890.1 Calcium-transporting ATPase [Anaerohalosphaera lusitana]
MASAHKEGNAFIETPWVQTAEDCLARAKTDPSKGLSDAEADHRRQTWGMNRLKESQNKSTWQILVNQFKSMIVAVLILAAIASFAFGDWIEGVAILIVVVINTVIGLFMELKAVRSMEALRQMEQITTTVLRDGSAQRIDAAHLVPGDIIILEAGDIVSSDMRLLEAAKLRVDESMLTGESVAVYKSTEPIDNESTPVADRKNMLFKGTALVGGSGKAVVTATGMMTELGHISELTEQSDEEEFTPLEKRLGQFGKKLLWITFGIVIVVGAVGVFQGRDMVTMIKTAVALAIAAIPEGLPIVATIAMARGMLRMARRNAIVKKLAAVETLGGTNVICTDKTGTLTENKMTVTQLALPEGKIDVHAQKSETGSYFEKDGGFIDPGEDAVLAEMLKVFVLCNNASLHEEEDKAVGDPLEVALLEAAAKADMHRPELADRMPEEREEAFDPSIRKMATFNREVDELYVAVKGAAEAVLEVSTHVREDGGAAELDEAKRDEWLDLNEKMAREGLRVLSAAYKTVSSTDEEPYEGLTFLGLIGMMDPPRQDVDKAIEKCHHAGLRVVMVTGDQKETAGYIASAIGLAHNDGDEIIEGKDIRPVEELSDDERDRFVRSHVFARVSPEQKLNLIGIHRKAGSVVAMTGDGVNDAPSLQNADIGIAMGGRGTQVAQEASDMVLKDDAFSTIVAAIEHGRIIFDNIRKFVVYLLSGNAGEIMIVFFASLLGLPMPILPLQILFLNIISDVFPALALGLSEGSGDEMNRPPRDSSEPVLTLKHWGGVFGWGLLIAVPVLAVFVWCLEGLEWNTESAVTISFLSLAFGRLWHIFNMRDQRSHFIKNEIVRNRYVWYALGLCTLLLLGLVYLPVISDVLQLTQPAVHGWTLIIAVSLIPYVLGQLFREIPMGESK